MRLILTILGLIATVSAAIGGAVGALSTVFTGTSALQTGLIAAGVSLLALGLVNIPIVLLSQREMERLKRHVASSSEGFSEGAYRAPFWIRPVSEAFARAAGAWSDRIEGLQAKLRDVEIRHSVAEAERRSCEAILNSLRDAVLVTDPFNELALANEPAARLLGFDLTQAAHRPLDQIISDTSLRRLIDEVRQSSVVNKQKHVEHPLAANAGEPDDGGIFDITLTCLPDGHNGSGGVVTILRDVTREKEISQMKSDFVSQASHELRTPLSSINAYIEMLIDSEADSEETRQEFYAVIKHETDRVSRMIDNMLNISRIESGIVQTELVEVDFVKLGNEVVETLRPQAALKKITLHQKTGPLLYSAEADRDMMYQVLVNLIGNAVKYTPEGGRITLIVDNDETSRSVLVTVADTGLGIPPEAIENVFSKFYRIESYKRVAKGTGLGLNLVKHIVETVHHGQVGVESEVGMGSRFWFTIPYEFKCD